MLLAVAALGVADLRIETSTDSVLDRSNPDWRFYQESLQRFGGDEVVVVALNADRAFSPDAIQTVASLEETLREVAGVRRVDSLASVPFIEAAPDGALALDPFVRGSNTLGMVSRLREAVSEDRLAPGTLISADGRVVALNVILGNGPSVDYDRILSEIRDSVAGQQVWISGVPVFRTEINKRTGSEILFFVGLTVLTVCLLMVWWFRSLIGAFIALTNGAAGSWLLSGAMGAAGEPMMLATMILPSLMLALGCAYSMHLLSNARGSLGQQQLAARLAEMAFPIGVSGLTTAVGFLGIAAVKIDAVRAVGIFGAIGVLAVCAFTLTGAPAILALRGLPEPKGVSAHQAKVTAQRLRRLAERHWRLVFLGWALAALACMHGLRLLNVETDAVLWFTEDSDVRRDYDAIRERLAGISPVNIVIEATTGSSVTEANAIRAIDSLTRHLASHPDVGRAISVTDPLRQIHGGFQGNAKQPLPGSRAAVEQYLLLLESVPHLDDLVTPDRSAANIKLRVDNNGSRHLLAVAKDAEEWWQRYGAEGTRAQATGIMYEFARAQDEISRGQVRGLVMAIGCIALLLGVVYRKPSVVGAALVPNVVPVFMVFGIMGLVGMPLDAGTVVVGSLALGIAVDDTVHVVTAYLKCRDDREVGGALELALRRVLVPITYTTLVVALGFGVLGFSEFTFTRNLGLLTAGIMVLCFVADTLLLPAVLVAMGRGSA